MSDRYLISDEWCRQIPFLHQILAGTRSPSDFPSPTKLVDLKESCAVWETLHYLFLFLLDWENPVKGLAWWYQHGQPTGDSKLLHTVKHLWGSDDAIDYYAAWAWSNYEQVTDVLHSDSEFPARGWWAEFNKCPEPVWHDPYHGGNNPLHLGHSEMDSYAWIGAMSICRVHRRCF
ncbi:hypothetical protein [Calycomorphotria hydatis]|uniref:Uncharacterized protein n=1 Tax=Calycomorphotria hydatis TaxID=2528027 RepID=A0A517T8P7_9PLAN|nr:hypothetical protein [Calycomorphotria hydatis]QDT64745.1 hypothetical protein V22_19860 [Calycomorphotria hydatis]